ncbi:MAG: thiamine pyrophosphate-dependent dehydrogenase E1 component subunit alpha [Nitrospirae bacterium]|nr:thiamine pyrophosphate-dependent dehydrogenase E1 component subunit alpha [Nitrospirota bacterium]
MVLRTNIDAKILIQLLYQMKRIRAVEETIAERYNEWKMRCPTHLCTGQEAVSAGVCAVLRKDDFVVSTHRAHGHYLAKGGDLKRMIAEIYGKAAGCSSGKGGSMHLIDKSVGFMGSTSIVGGTIPVGTGLGFSILLNGTDQISCVFFGDGATEEGVFYESINFAILKKLPVLYICENNLYSVYSPLCVRQPAERSISKMVSSLGIASDSGDGNDATEVYTKVINAVEHIRQGKGPFLLEFATYRWREHCGPNFDNDIGYRTEEEYLCWKKKDPIMLLENEMKNRDVFNPGEVQRVDSLIESEVHEAFSFAESSPFPSQDEAFIQLFKE